MKHYTIGIDFGTLSGRAVLMDVESGEIIASSVYEYPHAVMSEALPSGTELPNGTALQHPGDYIEVLKRTIPDVIRQANIATEQVVGLGIDFTACTMLPVDESFTPLCLNPEYEGEPHAYVKLWKHHTAQDEADELNRIAAEKNEPWLKYYGGKVSSEWMIPKIWQILNEAPEVYKSTARFMEAADWLSYYLTGEETHSAPFAGYKALWNAEDGYPSPEFFEALDSRMKDLVGSKLSAHTDSLTDIAGRITEKAAETIGLQAGIPVAIPVLDAHASMPALGITEPGTLLLVLGTSAVHMLHAHEKKEVVGICGLVRDGIIPGTYTYEAGQACCGDHFAWFVNNCVPSEYTKEAEEKGIGIHRLLRQKAQVLHPGESGLIALDWFNGNRSVLTDASLSGMMIGLTLRTKPEEIYRALIEGTAYGTRMILETFEKYGIDTDCVVATGGIAEKDEMLVQIYADVIGRPITVSNATMSASRGSAIFACVAAGIYPDVKIAAKHLAVTTGKEYYPIAEHSMVYDRLYREYKILHDYFGRGENDVMKRLELIREEGRRS